MVTVANGSADNPGGGGGGAIDLPFGMQAQEIVFKHPTAYTWSAGVQREVPWGFVVDATYVGRRGLYLQRERNINQLAGGTLQRNPASNIAALRPYIGYGAHPARGELRPLDLQQPAAQRRKRYSNGLKVGAAYTLGKSEDNGSDKRNVLWNTYDDTGYWGRRASIAAMCCNVYYIYDLPFWREQTR